MKSSLLPKSRAARVLYLCLIAVGVVLLALFMLVSVACNGDTGFSCGG